MSMGVGFRPWLFLIAALYVAALIAPALGAPPTMMRGFHCLILVPFAIGSPAWWANPALFLAYAQLARRRFEPAKWWGIAAVLLMASVPLLAGLNGLRLGYGLWLASGLAVISAAEDLREQSATPTSGDISTQ